VRRQVKAIGQLVDRLRRENRREQFRAITPAEAEQKLQRIDSPMIVAQGWDAAVAGSPQRYELTVYNPDPVRHESLFVFVLVRFSELRQAMSFGFALDGGAHATLSFNLDVPRERGEFAGNSFLLQLHPKDAGRYLDCGTFPFRVS
jgi:hypothetical protein